MNSLLSHSGLLLHQYSLLEGNVTQHFDVQVFTQFNSEFVMKVIRICIVHWQEVSELVHLIGRDQFKENTLWRQVLVSHALLIQICQGLQDLNYQLV